MKYIIKYRYITGDSDNSYQLEEQLELSWENLEVAKQNLIRIKEHYEQYRELKSYFSDKDDETILFENSQKDWFVKKEKVVCYHPSNKKKYNAIDESQIKQALKEGLFVSSIIDRDTAQNSLILYTDNHVSWQINVPWVGTFESLIHIEIDLDKTGMKFEF